MKRSAAITNFLLLSTLAITNQLNNSTAGQEPQKIWSEDKNGRFKWSLGCTFPNGGFLAEDINKIKSNQSSNCPNICYQENRCTHFIYSNGFCSLKSFKFTDASPKAAIYSNPGGLCGFLVERPDVVKNWTIGDNGRTRWSRGCEYPNTKYNIWSETKFVLDQSKCGDHCLSVKRCTHFVWATGICCLKDMNGVPVVQTVDKKIPLCGFIPERKDAAKQKAKSPIVSPTRISTSKLTMTTKPAIATTNNQSQKINNTSPQPKHG